MNTQSNIQVVIQFPTASPINQEKLRKQTQRLYDYLAAGNTIHLFHPAKKELKVGFLNSRIPEIKKAGYTVYKRRITVLDSEGEPTSVVEYSLKPFDIK